MINIDDIDDLDTRFEFFQALTKRLNSMFDTNFTIELSSNITESTEEEDKEGKEVIFNG